VSDECSITATPLRVNSGNTVFLKLFSDWRLGNEMLGFYFSGSPETQQASAVVSGWLAVPMTVLAFRVAAHS
jgi:hypothetical protein